MNNYLPVILLFLLPICAIGQVNDPGTKAVRDSLQKDSALRHTDSLQKDSALRHMDSLKKDSARQASDSAHYTDKIRYRFGYSGTGNINNTNTTHSYLLSNTVTFSAVKKRGAINLSNSWVYGNQQGNLTNNDYTATADLNLYKTIRHFYYWGLINYNTSLSLQINHLIQSGLGIGYNIIDKKKAALILSDGILYEEGDLYHILYGSPQGNISQRDQYQVYRNSLRIKYRIVIHDKVTLEGTELIQHSLATIHNYILNLSASGSVKLYKWLSLTAALAFNKFTRTRSENTLATFGVTIIR